MKLFDFLIPSGQKQVVQAVETWEVRWQSRYGTYSYDTKNEVMVFTSEEDAKKFADALKDAFKLTRNTGENWVDFKKVRV